MYRYFITDNSNVGNLVIGSINPQEMILILGKLAVTNNKISEITSFLETEFKFESQAKNLLFSVLNTDDSFPYTYYDLINERISDREGYLYSNIYSIKEYFLNADCVEMLLSIDFNDIAKNYFS